MTENHKSAVSSAALWGAVCGQVFIQQEYCEQLAILWIIGRQDRQKERIYLHPHTCSCWCNCQVIYGENRLYHFYLVLLRLKLLILLFSYLWLYFDLSLELELEENIHYQVTNSLSSLTSATITAESSKTDNRGRMTSAVFSMQVIFPRRFLSSF